MSLSIVQPPSSGTSGPLRCFLSVCYGKATVTSEYWDSGAPDALAWMARDALRMVLGWMAPDAPGPSGRDAGFKQTRVEQLSGPDSIAVGVK